MVNSFFNEIKALSREFYKRNRRRVVCIALVGSLAKEELITEDKLADVDILLVTRFYDVWLKRKFYKYLKKQKTDIDFDVGMYSLPRVLIEKSLFTYDLRHHSKILAGKDIRPLIPEISTDDLYPFEGFRLLLNRGVDLVKAVKNYSSTRIILQPESFDIAARRIQRSYIDSHLIFRKKYHPNFGCRVRSFSSSNRQIPKIENFEDARRMLSESIEDGLKLTGINSCEKLLNSMRSEFRYPFLFRIYATLTTKSLYALFVNPIFDVYRDVLNFLNQDVKKEWIDFKRDVLRKMDAPQPLLRK